MGIMSGGEYSSENRILNELSFALDLYEKIGCRVIDVTTKTIEETTSDIITIIDQNRNTN